VVRIEQIMAHLKGLSARIVMSSEFLVTWPKSHISNIRHDGILLFRNFIMMGKNVKNHNLEPILAYGHDPAKVPKIQNRA
jgi:hypothetical protein